MRKPYVAPDCEYMTFTVDSAIASDPCSYNGNQLGANFKQAEECSVMINGFKMFSNGEICAVTDTQGYCYYTSSISIFGS